MDWKKAMTSMAQTFSRRDTQQRTNTMAAPSAAEKYKKEESWAVTGVVVHTAAELSLLWDPSHSAKIASYKS